MMRGLNILKVTQKGTGADNLSKFQRGEVYDYMVRLSRRNWELNKF